MYMIGTYIQYTGLSNKICFPRWEGSIQLLKWSDLLSNPWIFIDWSLDSRVLKDYPAKNEGGQKWNQSIDLTLTNQTALVLRFFFIKASLHILHLKLSAVKQHPFYQISDPFQNGVFVSSAFGMVDVKMLFGSFAHPYLFQGCWTV